MKRQRNRLHFSCHCQGNPLSHLSPPPISSISQSYLKPLTLLLHIVSGWQASSQERRPRGGNGSRVTVWVAEWKAISILCQKGALKAEILATVAKACDVFPLRSTEEEKGNEKFSRDIFICFTFCCVFERCTLHIQIPELRVSDSEMPLEHLKIQYLTQGK